MSVSYNWKCFLVRNSLETLKSPPLWWHIQDTNISFSSQTMHNIPENSFHPCLFTTKVKCHKCRCDGRKRSLHRSNLIINSNYSYGVSKWRARHHADSGVRSVPYPLLHHYLITTKAEMDAVRFLLKAGVEKLYVSCCKNVSHCYFLPKQTWDTNYPHEVRADHQPRTHLLFLRIQLKVAILLSKGLWNFRLANSLVWLPTNLYHLWSKAWRYNTISWRDAHQTNGLHKTLGPGSDWWSFKYCLWNSVCYFTNNYSTGILKSLGKVILLYLVFLWEIHQSPQGFVHIFFIWFLETVSEP